MQSCASPAWLVRKAGLRVKPTFNAAYTNPRMKSNHPGVSFEAAIFLASFTCILSCNWESPTQDSCASQDKAVCSLLLRLGHQFSSEPEPLHHPDTVSVSPHSPWCRGISAMTTPQQLPEECRPCSNLCPGQGWRRWTERLCTFNQGYRSLSSHRSVISFQYSTAKLHFPWRFSVKCRA